MKKILYIYIVLYSSFVSLRIFSLQKPKKFMLIMINFLCSQGRTQNRCSIFRKIEVSGFSNDDAAVFSEIYKKAKSIGGNSYFMKPIENIEGNSTLIPHHYILYIYYKEKQTIPQKENTVYLINPEKK